MAEYWPSSFFVFMDQDGVEVHKLTEKEHGQYPAILTKQTSVVNRGYINMTFEETCRTRRVVLSRQHSSILPACVANRGTGFNLILPAQGASYCTVWCT